MGLGTNIRLQTLCQGSGDMGEDRYPAPAPKHPAPTFPKLCRDSTEGSLCNGKSLIILNQPTQCKISQSIALLQNITTIPVCLPTSFPHYPLFLQEFTSLFSLQYLFFFLTCIFLTTLSSHKLLLFTFSPRKINCSHPPFLHQHHWSVTH